MELDTPRADTRESLLDAAERRFAADGVEGASLRAITREAGANLAAVHYYFGSKEGLVEAVFDRRLAPLGTERLRRLEACRKDGPPDLECVLRAFVEPVVDAGRGVPREFGRLMCRCVAEREGVVRDVLARELRETFESFLQALAEALPGAPRRELALRLHLAVGAMAHAVVAEPLFPDELGGPPNEETGEETMERLVSFLAGGFHAAAGGSGEEVP